MSSLTKLLLFIGICTGCTLGKTSSEEPVDSGHKKIIVAYVTSWSEIMPDPAYMTHINYAFGHVNESFDGVRIDHEERLKAIVSLKQNHPELAVLLSIGGWGSGRFSEMAADEQNRKRFAADCQRVVKEFQLDGIDIDWEYPTSSAAQISSSPGDTENFTLLMQDIREAIGTNKLLTLASAANADFINFRAIDPYMDFINIMAYDMSTPPTHHSALYRSERAGRTTSDEAVEAHLAAGVPLHKLVLGMPFYGRGGKSLPGFMDYKKIRELEGYTSHWDEASQVPYLTDSEGDLMCTYDDPRSLVIKCHYILERGLLGGMY